MSYKTFYLVTRIGYQIYRTVEALTTAMNVGKGLVL